MCEHLHYPLQSGSDRVLAAMHRGYTAQRYLERLAEARRAVPDLAVSTDIIVGFPGETDDDFERTLEVVAAAEFDYAYTFIFSPRPGTEGATLTAAFAIRPWREASRASVVFALGFVKHQARVGLTGGARRGSEQEDPTVTSGRTRQNKLVHFRPDTPLRTGIYASSVPCCAAPSARRRRLVAIRSTSCGSAVAAL